MEKWYPELRGSDDELDIQTMADAVQTLFHMVYENRERIIKLEPSESRTPTVGGATDAAAPKPVEET